jgi:hypothetical protein
MQPIPSLADICFDGMTDDYARQVMLYYRCVEMASQHHEDAQRANARRTIAEKTERLIAEKMQWMTAAGVAAALRQVTAAETNAA